MPTGHTGTIIDITVTGIIDIGGELSRIKKRKLGDRPLAPCGTLPKTSYRGTNVGVGFGARFLAFALLAGISFFIPFFLRAGTPRFASLDFLATSTSRIGLAKIMRRGITPWSLILTSRTT